MPLAATTQAVDKEQQELTSLRSALEDVSSVLEALAPTCDTVEEIHGVVTLAMSNDGQLRLIMQAIKTRAKK